MLGPSGTPKVVADWFVVLDLGRGPEALGCTSVVSILLVCVRPWAPPQCKMMSEELVTAIKH